MEVLQKITIYDLLGYTVPGTIMVGVLEVCFFSSWLFDEKYLGYIWCLFVKPQFYWAMCLEW